MRQRYFIISNKVTYTRYEMGWNETVHRVAKFLWYPSPLRNEDKLYEPNGAGHCVISKSNYNKTCASGFISNEWEWGAKTKEKTLTGPFKTESQPIWLTGFDFIGAWLTV